MQGESKSVSQSFTTAKCDQCADFESAVLKGLGKSGMHASGRFLQIAKSAKIKPTVL
jgi:hypothetical protein